MKKVPLTPDVANGWASNAHAFYLDALMSETTLTCNQLAFHGGTSLHLSWNSPRYSEDLDFLLAKEAKDIDVVSERILDGVKERFAGIDPNFQVELRNKTKDANRMAVYHLVVSHPGYIGNAMIKVEFWRVGKTYLEQYPTEFRTPTPHGDMVSRLTNPVPAATLEAAYCDKLTAFATRPHLKWRDIYDLWWIGTQTPSALDVAAVAKQFLHNVSAYHTLGDLPPAEALREFTKRNRDEVIAAADPDLKRWLPPELWRRLNPDGVRQMVDYAFFALNAVADEVDARPVDVAAVNLKRVPPRV